jgi:hypothetical protein
MPPVVLTSPIVPPPPSVPVVAPIPRAYAKNVQAFSVQISPTNQFALAKLKQLGITCIKRPLTWVGVETPHPVSAAVRKYATVRALGVLHSMDFREVCSLYGHDRDIGLCDFINTSPNPVVPTERMTLRVSRPLITAQDIVRGHINDYEPHGLPLLMVDVYATPAGPLTPLMLLALLPEPDQILVWIGHRFRGDIGHAFGEAIWARLQDAQGNELVRFFADESAAAYPDHDPCDWIWQSQNSGELSWAYKEFFGDYAMVVFKRARTIEVASVQPSPDFQFETVEIPRMPRNFFERAVFDTFMCMPRLLKSLWPKETLVMNHELALLVSDNQSARPYGPYAYKSVVSALAEKIKANPIWKRMRLAFPKQFYLTLERTAIVVLLRDLEYRGWLLHSTNALRGNEMAEYNQNFKRFGSVETVVGYSTPVLCAGAVLSAGLYVLWRSSRIGTLTTATMKFGQQHLPKVMVKTVTKFFGGLWNSVTTSCRSWMTPHARKIFGDYCITVPLVEEAIKSISKPWMALAIAGVEIVQNVAVGVDIVRCIPATVFHLSTAHMSFWKRVLIHSLFNFVILFQQGRFTPGRSSSWIPLFMAALVTWAAVNNRRKPKTMHSVWNDFKNLVIDACIPLDSLLALPHGTHSIEVGENVIARSSCSTSNPPQCDLMRLSGTLPNDEMEHDEHFTHWILHLLFPFWVAARTDHNLAQTAVSRILTPPPMSPSDQFARWINVLDVVRDLFPQTKMPLLHEIFVKPWFDKFGSSIQKSRYIAAEKVALEVEARDFVVRGTTIMVKTNEAVSKYDEVNQCFYPKYRMIASVHPSCQYAIGPIIYGATLRMKEHWSVFGNQFEFPNGWVVRVYWGAGSTDEDLTKWMAQILSYHQNAVFINVAGDDSLIGVNQENTVTFYESDARMYDQSQSFGPLMFERQVLSECLGVEDFVVDLLEDMSFAQYLLPFKNWPRRFIKRDLRPTRDTGGPDTTFGNTITMAALAIHFFANLQDTSLPTAESMYQSYSHLGIDIKLKMGGNPTEVTFLKGTWYWAFSDKRSEFGAFVWSHLPSRVLKMGKSFEDPSTLYSNMNYVEACTRFLHDQGTAVRGFLQVPVTRAFVSRWNKGKPKKLEEWQVQTTGLFSTWKVDPQCMFDLLDYRYNISESELVEMENMIHKAEPFSFLVHPGFIKLGLVDYALGSLPSEI